MKIPTVKQLIMPTIITFILIIASFTIASKYELKSIMKQPVKIITPSFHQNKVPATYQEDTIRNSPPADTTSVSTEAFKHALLKPWIEQNTCGPLSNYSIHTPFQYRSPERSNDSFLQ